VERALLGATVMQTQTRQTGSYDRALGMRGSLLDIAERAEAEAMRCSHVLAALDLARARACRDLARRARALAHAILEWRHTSTPQERRLADALEYQSIVEDSGRILEGDRPTLA
jgi:hypothetical protein